MTPRPANCPGASGRWDGRGSLSFIASFHCASLPTAALDIGLPEAGTLLFSSFDGRLDDGEVRYSCRSARGGGPYSAPGWASR